ncbi:MAG: sulfatase-like hydrolase/transferase [Planctomycetes bacterium]|nr:sulfatase-like hydrolase/transferase [Planctomycetota bacterium]
MHLRLTISALGFSLLFPACSNEPTGPASVILVTIDTTRADALGCYGGAADTSPHIDAFSAQSVRFDRAYTVAPLTLPAHASMLTGLYPPRHGVRDNGRMPLPPSAITLAEIAQEHSIQTAAFLSAAVLSEGFGINQGFDVFDAPGDTGAQQDTHFPSRTAPDTLGRTLRWLREERDPEKGFFLWVHLWEPHAPYQPPAVFRRSRPYLGEIAAADDAFGTLLATLEDLDLDGHTAIALTSDHGEAFGEHQESTHGAFCFNTTMRVPLIVHTPQGQPGVDDRPASVTDLFPTLASFLQVPHPAHLDGRNLLLPEDPDAGVYLETLQGWYAYGWSPIRGWVNREGKYLQGGRDRFFDPDADPGERKDLVATADLIPFQAALANLDQQSRLRADGVIDSALAEQVESLGYAQVAGQAGEVPEDDIGRLPDPADQSQELKLCMKITDHGNRKEFKEAIRLCEQLLQQNRHNIWAWEMLGSCAMAIDEVDRAIPALQRVIKADRGSARTYGNLAVAFYRAGRKGEARAPLQEALKRNPDHQVFRALARELKMQ